MRLKAWEDDPEEISMLARFWLSVAMDRAERMKARSEALGGDPHWIGFISFGLLALVQIDRLVASTQDRVIEVKLRAAESRITRAIKLGGTA